MRILKALFFLLFMVNTMSGSDSISTKNINEQLKDIVQQIREALDENIHGRVAELYLQRAKLYQRHYLDKDYIKVDLELSSDFASKINDSIGYHDAKITWYDVLIDDGLFTAVNTQELDSALVYFNKKDEHELSAYVLHIYGKYYEENTDHPIALKHFQQADEILKILPDSYLSVTNNMAIQHVKAIVNPQEDIHTAIDENLKNYKICQSLGNDHLTAKVCLRLAKDLIAIDSFEKSRRYLMAGAILNTTGLIKADINKLLKEIYELKGDYKTAMHYSDLRAELLIDYGKSKETALSITVNQSKIEDLGDALSTQKKKTNEVTKKNQIATRNSVILLIAVLASFLAMFYIMRFYNQKLRVNELIAVQREEIDKQRINKLESNLKIESLSSMVAGQEAERNRIANDLHDSLGGTLSALKLQFENAVLNNNGKSKSPFKNISQLIDGACSEVREISRNLKPAALENIGLEAAITDLINKYNAKKGMEMSLYADVGDLDLDNDVKLNLYRIVQELLNNAMRHANASEVDVQLTRVDGDIIIKVEDNGKGFNINWVEKGLGLDSIQSRVNVLKGDLNIDSTPDVGTSFVIHIPTSQKQLISV